MRVRKYKFPIGSEVAVQHKDNEIVVTASIPDTSDKPNARRLPGNMRYSDGVLDELMLALVIAMPGRAKTYYTQLKIEDGGIGAALDRKEKSLMRLACAGEIFHHPLPSPQGRKTYEIWPRKY